MQKGKFESTREGGREIRGRRDRRKRKGASHGGLAPNHQDFLIPLSFWTKYGKNGESAEKRIEGVAWSSVCLLWLLIKSRRKEGKMLKWLEVFGSNGFFYSISASRHSDLSIQTWEIDTDKVHCSWERRSSFFFEIFLFIAHGSSFEWLLIRCGPLEGDSSTREGKSHQNDLAFL